MAITRDTVVLRDDRTKKVYWMTYLPWVDKDFALEELQKRMDYDYFESLPAEVRAQKMKHNLDFTCPNCLEKTEVSSRKEKITKSVFLFVSTNLIDIFKCHKCNNEFLKEDLVLAIDRKRRENLVIENFENWKDAKRKNKNLLEFSSFDKVDEIIIMEFKN